MSTDPSLAAYGAGADLGTTYDWRDDPKMWKYLIDLLSDTQDNLVEMESKLVKTYNAQYITSIKERQKLKSAATDLIATLASTELKTNADLVRAVLDYKASQNRSLKDLQKARNSYSESIFRNSRSVPAGRHYDQWERFINSVWREWGDVNLVSDIALPQAMSQALGEFGLDTIDLKTVADLRAKGDQAAIDRYFATRINKAGIDYNSITAGNIQTWTIKAADIQRDYEAFVDGEDSAGQRVDNLLSELGYDGSVGAIPGGDIEEAYKIKTRELVRQLQDESADFVGYSSELQSKVDEYIKAVIRFSSSGLRRKLCGARLPHCSVSKKPIS